MQQKIYHSIIVQAKDKILEASEFLMEFALTHFFLIHLHSILQWPQIWCFCLTYTALFGIGVAAAIIVILALQASKSKYYFFFNSNKTTIHCC
jgi:hypothetical protein